MIPKFDKVHIRFKLNGIHYNHIQLKELAYSYIKEGADFEKAIGAFLGDWLDNKPYIKTKTSGSTGVPKTIKVEKQSMVNSAIATGDFFNLKPGNKALMCLPAQVISGKMMLIRAMMLGLELDSIKPSKEPKINPKKQYNFCAMIPMQLQHCLQKNLKIKTIIVGGAAVSDDLINNIQTLNSTVYETYGMTETVSHIAVKQLNSISKTKIESYFSVLPNITISQDERNCLVIEAPYLSNAKIITNDIVVLHSKTSFEWLGRYDNVINSGGVKLFPEVIEKKLQNVIKARFFITSKLDSVLGEKLVLIVEGSTEAINYESLESLNKHEFPKEIISVPKFVETNTGKIQRNETIRLLKTI